MAVLTQDDLDQIEAFRATATPEETAKFTAELYKLRNTPNANFFTTFPRWLIVLIAVWFGLLETAEKLPQLLLSFPRYQAALAEAQAKLIQPELAQAQLEKAKNDAEASALQPKTMEAQLAKLQFEADAARFQPATAEAQLKKLQFDVEAAKYQPTIASYQLDKLKSDTKTAEIQPELTSVQLEKTKLEAQAAAFQPPLNQMQLVKLGIDTKIAGVNLPVTEQGAAFGNAVMSFMNVLAGIKPPSDTGTASSRPAETVSSRPIAPPTMETAPASSRPAAPRSAEDRIATLVSSAKEAAKRGDCDGIERAYDQILNSTSESGLQDIATRNRRLFSDIQSLSSRKGDCDHAMSWRR
jgi:hypothetical protein